eukprot:jgi/Chrzof1/14112/Cz08g25160.t1
MTSALKASGGFIPFLPTDNADLTNPTTQSVLTTIHDDLSRLLRLPAGDFWDVVRNDRSLVACLDSYLRFKRRAHDDVASDIQGTSQLSAELYRKVFMVLWRMVSTSETKQGAPNPAQQASFLYNNWIFDVPKLMDICVLYGSSNKPLVSQLIGQLFTLQPKYADDISNAAALMVDNLQQLTASCVKLAQQVLQGQAKLVLELAEAVKYFKDTCMTLSAFVSTYPAAALLLLNPGQGALLAAVAQVHDQLLPLLVRVARQQQQQAVAAPGGSQRVVQGLSHSDLQQLQQYVLGSVFMLLKCGFLSGEGRSKHTSKDPEAAGEQLMSMLMAVAHGGMDGSVGSSSGSAAVDHGLLQALNAQYQLVSAIGNAMQQGLLAVDDAQLDYLLALTGAHRQQLHSNSSQHQQHNAASSSSSTSTGTGTAPLPAPPVDMPESAVLMSLMSQVTEVLPDYGEGFLTACLHHYNWNAEQVIDHLLEGSLPPALATLDTQAQHWQPPTPAAGSAANTTTHPAGKGKGKMPSMPTAGAMQSQGAGQHAIGSAYGGGSSSSAARDAPASSSALSWTALAQEARTAAAATSAASSSQRNPPLPSSLTNAPKPRTDKRTARILGAVSDDVRAVTKTMADELQYEYDDEYDDSFDDLIGLDNDGLCDIEGDDTPDTRQALQRQQQRGVGSSKGFDTYEDEPGNAYAGASSSSSSAPSQGYGRGQGFGRAQPQQQQQGQQTRLQPPHRQQQQQQQQHYKDVPQARRQQQGTPGAKPKSERLWVLDGKVYNYTKPGAQEVQGQQGAQQAVRAAQQAAEAIHGLGPGGNVPLQPPSSSDSEGGEGGDSQGEGPAQGRGRGRGAGGGEGAGRGRGRGSYASKEKHKAAVGNHHRKDRAFKKMGLS